MNNPFEITANRPPVLESELKLYTFTGFIYGVGLTLFGVAIMLAKKEALDN